MRFNLPQPKNPSKEQARLFNQDKVIPIHFRVFNVLKLWSHSYLTDFQEVLLAQRAVDFVNSAILENSVLSKAGSVIVATLCSSKAEQSRTPPLTFIQIGEAFSTSSVCERENLIQWNITNYDPKALAEQLTLSTGNSYFACEPREFLHKVVWDTQENRHHAPNIWLLNHNIEALKRWIKTELFFAPNVKARAGVIGFFLRLTQCLFQLQNYHDGLIIFMLFETLKLSELALAWKWLDLEFLKIYESLSASVKSGCGTSYDKKSVTSQDSTLLNYYEPYFLRMGEIWNLPDFLEKKDLINFEKWSGLSSCYANVINEKRKFLLADNLSADGELIQFLQNVPCPSDQQLLEILSHMDNTPPAGIPPSVQATTNEIEQSLTTNMTRLFDEEDPMVMKFLRELFTENVLYEVSQTIFNHCSEFSHSLDLELQLLIDSQTNCSHRDEFCLDLVKQQFPDHFISPWEKIDHDGQVLGRQDDVIHLLLACSHGQTIIVDTRYSATLEEIRYLKRVQEFYEEHERINTSVSLLLFHIDHAAQELADQLDITVVLL
jgi:hypothetical protein